MGNCCCKSQYETEEACTMDPALKKPQENVVVVNGAPTSHEVIENVGTYTENVNKPQRGDEQNIVVSTEQADKPTTADGYTTIVTNDSGTQENTQNTSQPRTTYVTNENREQDYVIDDKRDQYYVVNDRRENNYSMAQGNYITSGTTDQALPLAPHDRQQAMANAYVPHEITEPALLAGETERNTTLPAYTPNTRTSAIAARYSTMVPNGYVEVGPTQAIGYTERNVTLEEVPHYEYEKAGIVSQGVNVHGGEELGVVFQGRCYQKRVFDQNLGEYVYIAD